MSYIVNIINIELSYIVNNIQLFVLHNNLLNLNNKNNNSHNKQKEQHYLK